jgi:hypothetical protein
MYGMASLHIQTDTTPDPSTTARCSKHFGTLRGEAALEALRRGQILESLEATGLQKDYDPLYPLLAHPTVFIHGEGECPTGMKESTWVKIILRRPPLSRTERPEWILAENNRQQRHCAYIEAHAQLFMTPDSVKKIGSLDPAVAEQTAELFRQDHGPPRKAALAAAPEAVKALFSSIQFAAGRMANGSPQSIARARSESSAANLLWGEDTLWITINPSEAHSRITMDLAGVRLEYSLWDAESAHPTMAFIKEVVANHPSAAEELAHLHIRAFLAVFLGWPMGSKFQVNPDCFFGPIKFYDVRYETEDRGNVHAHIGAKGVGNARYIAKVRVG